MPHNTNVAIIGAGPAGLVAGAYLLDQGIDVTIVEKAVFPRIIVGESLLPLSMGHFKEVGYFEALNQAGFTIKPGARFILGKKFVDFSFAEQYTDAWKWTWQVPRADFDMIMADEFQKRGGKIEFGATITDIDVDGDPVIKYSQGEASHELTSKFIIDASGFGCVLARSLGMEVHHSEESNWAVFSHMVDKKKTDYPLPDRITFHVLHQDLWMWVIPFSTGTTSVGFAGNKKYFQHHNGDDTEFLRSLIAMSDVFSERFEGAEVLFEPKWYRGFSQHASQLHGENWCVCGNTAEFLDPVFSSGVGLATHSGLLAAKLIARQLDGQNVDWDSEYDDNMRRGVDVFRTYIDMWYNGKLQDIFFSDHFNEGFKRQICSVLAGYVWDESNSFVRKHRRGLEALHAVSTM